MYIGCILVLSSFCPHVISQKVLRLEHPSKPQWSKLEDDTKNIAIIEMRRADHICLICVMIQSSHTNWSESDGMYQDKAI